MRKERENRRKNETRWKMKLNEYLDQVHNHYESIGIHSRRLMCLIGDSLLSYLARAKTDLSANCPLNDITPYYNVGTSNSVKEIRDNIQECVVPFDVYWKIVTCNDFNDLLEDLECEYFNYCEPSIYQQIYFCHETRFNDELL